MGIAITFRHMDSTEALKTYVHEKLERVQKYLRAPLDAHVTLFQERHQFVAEMLIKAGYRNVRVLTGGAGALDVLAEPPALAA